MKSNIHKATTCCSMLLGIGLWAGFSVHFNAEDKLTYEPNPACIKGSPYGKVLALAMQGPISFYWHQGKTCGNNALKEADHSSHKHTEHQADESHASSCGGCDGCGAHEEEAPVVVKTKAKESHSSGCSGCDSCGSSEEDSKVVENRPQMPLRELAKLQIKKMSATAERKTDGRPLSPAHRKYLQSVTEDKLRLAYELDPTNYTNYGNYHLFLATTSFGKSDADDSKALELARKTLETCRQDEVDPASWVTAASAAYNIIYHIGRYHNQYTVAEAKASLKEFDDCMVVYERLLADAVENERILSAARLNELNERVRYMSKLRRDQGVYMKRMMSTQMAGNVKSKPTQ